MSSFAQFGCDNGPIAEVPEDYVPEVLISDEEFEAIYALGDKASKADKFHARDYAVDQFLKTVRKSYEEGWACPDDLFMQNSRGRLRALFWAAKDCSCCWRHCHKRPVAVDSWVDQSMLDRVTQAEIDESRGRCFCHCRSLKRHCRFSFWGEDQGAELAELHSDEE